MPVLKSTLDTSGEKFSSNRQAMEGLLEELREQLQVSGGAVVMLPAIIGHNGWAFGKKSGDALLHLRPDAMSLRTTVQRGTHRVLLCGAATCGAKM